MEFSFGYTARNILIKIPDIKLVDVRMYAPMYTRISSDNGSVGSFHITRHSFSGQKTR
jgi:hypothetical protein